MTRIIPYVAAAVAIGAVVVVGLWLAGVRP
jgi:hypothetical protein